MEWLDGRTEEERIEYDPSASIDSIVRVYFCFFFLLLSWCQAIDVCLKNQINPKEFRVSLWNGKQPESGTLSCEILERKIRLIQIKHKKSSKAQTKLTLIRRLRGECEDVFFFSYSSSDLPDDVVHGIIAKAKLNPQVLRDPLNIPLLLTCLKYQTVLFHAS